MNFQPVKDALLSVTSRVHHYFAGKQECPYIIWAEDSQAGEAWSDNRMGEQAIQGTVDYFTRQESDPAVDRIQQALNDAGIPFRLNSVQFEEKERIIHYEWVWELWQ